MNHGRVSKLRILALLIVGTLLLPMAACKGKNNSELRRKCEGAVEDYFEYLKREKNEKLSRYIDPSEDKFQQLDDSEQSKVFLIYQKTITYEIDTVSLDGNDAVVKVYTTVRDATDVNRTLGSAPTVSDVEEAVDKISASINKTLELELTYDKSSERFQLLSSDDIYNMIDKQASKIYDKLTKGEKTDGSDYADEFARALQQFDLKYISSHTDLQIDGDYDTDNQQEFYKIEMNTLQYSYTVNDSSADYTVVTFHFSKKNGEEAFESVMSDKSAICELITPYVQAIVKGEDFDTPRFNIFSYLDVNAICDNFATALNLTSTVNCDVQCKITYNGKNGAKYEFEDDLDDVLPAEDCMDFMPDYSIDEQNEMFLGASKNALEAGLISEKDYNDLVKAFSAYPLSDNQVQDILTKHGLTREQNTVVSDPSMYFSNGEDIMVNIEVCDSFEDAYEKMVEYIEDAKNDFRNGDASGKIEGGPLDLDVFANVNGAEVRIFGCVIQNRVYVLQLLGGRTGEEVNEFEALLEELKLVA